MYVCVCRGITNKDIQSAVKDGCESFGDLKAETGISMQCGTCAQLAEIEFEMAHRGWKTSTQRKVQFSKPLPIVSQQAAAAVK